MKKFRPINKYNPKGMLFWGEVEVDSGFELDTNPKLDYIFYFF